MSNRPILQINRQEAKKVLRGPGSLGPVPNLEEYVSRDWWRTIFNSMYLKTDGDVVDDPRITSSEIDTVGEILDLNLQDRILDLCCGQGRHTLELAQRGFVNVEGLDRSRYLVQKARLRAKSLGLAIKFREGDARKLPHKPDEFDAVLILGNSFGYFDSIHDDLRVLQEVARILKPWGRLLIDLADGDYIREHFQKRSWEWIDQNMFVCRERSLSGDAERLLSREVITHVSKGVLADQFYAERLYSEKAIYLLLERAGFSDVMVRAELHPDSQRAQDLGMMERRLAVTARIRKEWTPINRKSVGRKKHIAVILGDPKKPDHLKPGSVFDDDDFYTIDKMKSVFRELNGYRVSYLTNHDTLVGDLLKMRGHVDLILNLCDEGYLNDPRKELHVPAILETLGLPYSGSGPQCLAFCYDKSLVRGVAMEMGIPVPQAHFIRPEDTSYELPFDFPVLVKPNVGDSSFGITERSVAWDVESLINAVVEIRQNLGYEKPLLVEEFLPGSDLTLGIIGNPPSSYLVLPIAEEDYSGLPEGRPKICGYEAKWCPDSPYWQIRSVPAMLPEQTRQALIEWSTVLAERLECRDYMRFDWRLDKEGQPRLLEVNPNPGWCWDGHLAKMAAMDGMGYADMLESILRAAEDRLGMELTAVGRVVCT
jgi:D-alanine-D-alanine ligase